MSGKLCEWNSDALTRECDRLRAVNADLRRRAEEAQTSRDVTMARLQNERDAAWLSRQEALDAAGALVHERDALRDEVARVTRERDAEREALAYVAGIMPKPREPQPRGAPWRSVPESAQDGIEWAVETVSYAMRRELESHPPDKRNRLTVSLMFGDEALSPAEFGASTKHVLTSRSRDHDSARCNRHGQCRFTRYRPCAFTRYRL